MTATPRPTQTWRDSAFLTLSEAAEIAGRSYSWARDRMIEGRLDRRHVDGQSRICVTASSLARLLDGDRYPMLRAHAERKSPPHLRVAWTNPNR